MATIPTTADRNSARSNDHNLLLDVWAYDKKGEKVYPYKGKQGAKDGRFSVNFTNDTRRFEAMDEQQLAAAIRSGRFRDRGTIRMCRGKASSGCSAFAPVMFRGKEVKSF